MIPNTSLRIAGEKWLFFFPLLNHLSGLIKVDRIKRVVSVGWICCMQETSSLFTFIFCFSHLSPSCFILEIHCSFTFPTSFLPLPVSVLLSGCRVPYCLPFCHGTDTLSAPLWLMPIPVLACPYFQALFIVLVLRECQALSEEELKGMRETEIWLSYLEKLKTAKWLRWTRCGHSETLMAETQADGWSS